MKKAYKAPQLTNHGSINTVTQVSNDDNRIDTLFGPPGGTTPVSADQGSVNACIIRPRTTTCL